MINTMSTTTTTTFARSNLSLAVTLFRLFVVFNIFIPVDLMEWLHSANIRSILIDPIYTIRHVEEAAAIRRLSLGRGSGDDAMIGTTGSISITNGKGTDTSHFVDSYRGHESGNSRVHLPPLVLASVEWLISLIPTTAHDNYQHWKQIAIALAILCVDVWIALSLERLAANILQREGPRELQLLQRMDPRIASTMAHLFPVSEDTIKASQEPSGVLFQWRDVPLLVAHMYYCSPITMLAGSGAPMNGCFQNIRLAFLVSALAEASTVPSSSKTSNTKISSATVSAFALAVATYFDIHNILFLVPIVIWHGSTKAKTVCFLWDVFTFAFQALSVILVGEQSYFTVAGATHLYPYQYKGLAPSLSMLWYFGMESFIRFRPYFELLLGGLPFLVAIPLTIRLHRYPSVLVWDPTIKNLNCLGFSSL